MLTVPPLTTAATAQLDVLQLALAAADAAITTGSYQPLITPATARVGVLPLALAVTVTAVRAQAPPTDRRRQHRRRRRRSRPRWRKG